MEGQVGLELFCACGNPPTGGAQILQVTFRNNSLNSLKAKGFDILEDSDERLVIGHKDLPFYMEGVSDE